MARKRVPGYIYRSAKRLRGNEQKQTQEFDVLKQQLRLIGAFSIAKEQLRALSYAYKCPLCSTSLKLNSVALKSAIANASDVCSVYLKTIRAFGDFKRLIMRTRDYEPSETSNAKLFRKRASESFKTEFVRGKFLSLKEQKSMSMKLERCLCCGSSLASDRMGLLLKTVDSKLVDLKNQVSRGVKDFPFWNDESCKL